MGLDDVVVLHVQAFWGVAGLDGDTVEEESDVVGAVALSLTEGVHESAQGGVLLDLEEHLSLAVGDLYADLVLARFLLWCVGHLAESGVSTVLGWRGWSGMCLRGKRKRCGSDTKRMRVFSAAAEMRPQQIKYYH